MSRATLKAAFAEMEAEDRAVSFLAKLPANAAALVALTVAKSEAKWWQVKKIKMIELNDRRPVYDVHSQDTAFLDAELAAIAPDCALNTSAQADLSAIIKNLSIDASTQVSFNVARWAAHRAKSTES